jgi:hypothetical protein
MRKFVALFAAAGMAAAPLAAHAQDASALSLSRASAPMLPGFSFLQDQADDDDDNSSTAVILGVVLLVLLGAAAISGDGGAPLPNSP